MSESKTVLHTPTPSTEHKYKTISTILELFWIKGRLGVFSYMARTMVVYLATIFVSVLWAIKDSSLSEEAHLQTLVLYLLPLVWIGVTLLVKRLHDINMRGWWVLTMSVPIIGLLFSLYIGLLPGDSVDNRFGKKAATKNWENRVGKIAIVFVVIIGLLIAGLDLYEALGHDI